ncbi:hypothetical protein A2526_01770 [candidate division WOR-1 bacterium RIFOXYD2_FULL_36_8]|uniref:Metallo-beta-lactamase domain-containing protein n=1 Tax=candidate division WOR-1 bacterium RIFOXYB2_FULL_36_35 TaxID=1802578 RepID=A0A1F4S5Z8_UNCSA|nr:MAG: hypothetical protein A2230_02950 [candidate division WOR-1 bacterium RIFOXYA2_FULL_36_21]OGC15137.1 MAG: hypothetical protein A2282_08990 [candidate division WOR-1 bacterium RIFOXYA12_FULL_36_13]OGC15163.1 MAG: hypothetical protein A2290_08860 [candidate division WOR-1 bacterium RIFOXYB2_FULL_36_35]OGC41834.1 MAG: hypothetical protein A2526_01770 [candidate division WOR-1 bacterium RIFOXYD2_FULL_36_8]
MFQLLKIHLDEKRWESWENLNKIPSYTRQEWIKKHLNEILKTLDNIKHDKEFSPKPWHLIGFICINENLYKEAETIYDLLFKKLKHHHDNFGIAAYYRGISRFLQGRFKEAYEDFTSSYQFDQHIKSHNSQALKALDYMEETIFPTREIIRKNQDKLIRDLNTDRQLEYKIGANVIRTIHKWNSSSPLFSGGISQGGGYFLSLRNKRGEIKGIAIDPGYDFLDIFRSIGLSIVDIDAIIITHDHDDHTESVEGILSLLAKYNDHNHQKRSKVLDVFGSAGVLLKFHGLLSATDLFGNKEINFKMLVPGNHLTEVGGESLESKYGFTISIKPAYHTELWTSQESSVGLVLHTSLQNKNGEYLHIGITGDTRYETGIGYHYKECQILLLNIGSIEKEEGKYLSQHLGMLGCINMLKEARLGKPLLAILTEFGEEFSGKREVISHIIEKWAHPMAAKESNNYFRVIPADVNLEIKLQDLTIRDSDTNVFFPYQSIFVDENNPELLKYRFNG